MVFLRRILSAAAAAIPVFAPGIASPARSEASQESWSVAYDHQGNATALAPVGLQQMTGFDLTCSRERQVIIQAVIPGQANGGGRLSIALNFADGNSASLATGWEWGEGTWFNLADDRVVRLLTGRSEWVEINLNGRSIGRLSLAGSTRALNEALVHCLSPRPAASPTAGTSAFPPLPHGFYAVSMLGESTTCADAARADGMNYIYLTPEVWREWDGDSALTRARQTSDGRWRLGTMYFDDLDIIITGPATFREAGAAGRSFRHCAIETVPATDRQNWIRPVDRSRPAGNG